MPSLSTRSYCRMSWRALLAMFRNFSYAPTATSSSGWLPRRKADTTSATPAKRRSPAEVPCCIAQRAATISAARAEE